MNERVQCSIYLSGGIAGLSASDCNDWRQRATELLDSQIGALDPMRWNHAGRSDAPVSEIVERDLRDIDECAAVLVKVNKPSWGTAMEIRYAYQLGKPVIAFGVPNVASAWLEHHCSVFFRTIEEAVEYLNTLLVLKGQ